MADQTTQEGQTTTTPADEADQQHRALFEAEVLALENDGAAGAAAKATPGAGGEPTPTPTQTPTPTPTPAPKDDAPRIAAKLELGQLTPEEIEALRQLPNALKTIGGRVSKMQGEMEKIGQQAATTTTGEGGAAPTKDQIKAASTDLTKWNRLKTDFPEWGEAFEERLAAMAQPAAAAAVNTDELVSKARDAALTQARAEREAEREAEIAEEVPDWKQRLQTPEFVDWFNAQPGDYRTRKWNSRSPTAIIGMLRDHERAVSQQQQGGGGGVDPAQQSGAQSAASAPARAAATTTAPAVDLAAAVTKRGGAALPRANESELDGKALWDHLTRETATK